MDTIPTSIAGIKLVSAKEPINEGICIALYGAPGVGKTPIAARLALSEYGGRVLHIDVEGGTKSIVGIDNVDIAKDIKSWQQLQTLSQSVTSMERKCPWGTVILDNMSEIQTMHMKTLTQGPPQFDHWNQNTTTMLNFTRLWRDFARFTHVNVILIAWEAPELDKDTNITKRDVGFTPSLARQFPGIVDIVGYLTVVPGSQVRELSFAPSIRTAAKLRESVFLNAARLPRTIRFTEEHNVLGDVLSVLRGGKEWPAQKYAPPKKES